MYISNIVIVHYVTIQRWNTYVPGCNKLSVDARGKKRISCSRDMTEPFTNVNLSDTLLPQNLWPLLSGILTLNKINHAVIESNGFTN